MPATPSGAAPRFGFDELVDQHGTGVLTPPGDGTAATYLDGAEQYLLDALRSVRDVSVHSPELRPLVRDWASLYHLTPYRGTIMDALGMEAPQARVLELGAGCGAVTRWLGERFDRVEAVEGSLARATVARERCRDLPGVRFSAANFFDLDFAGGFDLTTLIGVLEYSHLYHPVHGSDPDLAARSNLELVRESLVEDGTLVVAIENKLGLKYLTGGHEDHASRRYEGIEGYPSRRSAVTWSAAELEQMLLDAGFQGVDFYLPFPDYKLARTILDAAAADASTYPANWIETPFPDRAGAQAAAAFDESLALREIVKGGLLRDLANSFVVLAYNGDRERSRARLGIEDGWVARHYSLDRRQAFRKRASLEHDGGTLVVRNTAVVPAAPQPSPALGLVQTIADEQFHAGHQALFELREHAAAGRLPAELPRLLGRLRDFLVAGWSADATDELGIPLLRGDAIDVTLWNVIADAATGEWHPIDGEWRFAGLLPLDYVVWRGMLHTASRFAALPAASGLGVDDPKLFALACARLADPAAGPSRLALYEELEGWLQQAAGAAGTGEPVPPPRVRALIALAEAPRRFQAVAFADELIDHPGLLAAYAEAFTAADAATLVLYAPGTDPAEIVPPLEALLAETARTAGNDPDVLLVTAARDDLFERRLATSAGVLLSQRPAPEPFTRLPRLGAGDAAALRALAFPPAEEAAACTA